MKNESNADEATRANNLKEKLDLLVMCRHLHHRIILNKLHQEWKKMEQKGFNLILKLMSKVSHGDTSFSDNLRSQVLDTILKRKL